MKKKRLFFVLPSLIDSISIIFGFVVMYFNTCFNSVMVSFKINNFFFFFCFIFFLGQSEQFFFNIFMVFPVCQNKIKECMEFLCLSNYHDELFIKECMLFYNNSMNSFGLK